jgi:hypothetical protein
MTTARASPGSDISHKHQSIVTIDSSMLRDSTAQTIRRIVLSSGDLSTWLMSDFFCA